MALNLEIGRRPWLPTADAVPGKVLDHYDNMPLTGYFWSHGEEYLYECLWYAPEEDVNLWAYTRVTDAARITIASAKGLADFDRAVRGAFRTSDSPATLAIANMWKLAFIVDLRGGIKGVLSGWEAE